MVLTTAVLYDVSRLLCLQLLLDLLHCSCTTTTQSLSGGWVGWVPTNYQVHSQLMLRLSWAVTTCVYITIFVDLGRNCTLQGVRYLVIRLVKFACSLKCGRCRN